MSSHEYEDYCDVWPENPNPKIPPGESPSRPMFCLVFHVSFIHLSHDSMEEQEDEALEINSLTETVLDDRIFHVERDELIDNNSYQQTIEEILSWLGVPSRPFFVEKILGCARSMANDKLYDRHGFLRMHVRISAVVDEEASDYEDDDEEENAMVGASKDAIEKLETVMDHDQSISREQCAICLEEFPVGLQVTRLPCRHIFHRNCIVNWLSKSKFCPLCRFEIN